MRVRVKMRFFPASPTFSFPQRFILPLKYLSIWLISGSITSKAMGVSPWYANHINSGTNNDFISVSTERMASGSVGVKFS